MENIKVEPIGTMQINWHSYILFAKEILGISPTKMLDEYQIDLNNPSAFINSIPIGRKPYENVTDLENIAFELFSFTFAIQTNKKFAYKLSDYARRVNIYSETGDDLVLHIAHGTLKQWISAINYASRSVTCKEIRYIFNLCYIYFKRGGFSRVWEAFDEITLKDGTIILQRKRF